MRPWLRAVLFDATGTLIELVEPVGETYARIAREHGVDVPPERIEAAFRRSFARFEPRSFEPEGAAPEDLPSRERSGWRRLVRATFASASESAKFPDFEAFFERLYAHYATECAWRLRPGARAALTQLRDDGLGMGVASNFDHRLIEILEALEFRHFFRSVTLPEADGLAKPARAFFERALAALDASPDETAYVGDDPEIDLAGARAAGLRAVDVTKLSSLAELPAHLATLAPHR